MALPCSKSRDFFQNGTAQQFEWVLNLYDQCLRLKAEKKSQKPENVIKQDKWYQTELPKKIKSRGKDPHLVHDELVQTIKWKLSRGKFRPNLSNLVQMNTPRVVMTETKKAFRNVFKKQDLHAGVQALCNLKGVGPAMASAVLAAGAPEIAPFMADECLMAMPDVDSLDYTMKEYMRYVDFVNECVERLNSQGGQWTPHKVELAVWSFYIANDLKPELLSDLPSKDAAPAAAADAASDDKAAPGQNGQKDTDAAPANHVEANGSASAAEDSNQSAEDNSNMSAGENSNGSSTSSSETTPTPAENGNSNGSAAAASDPEPEASNGAATTEVISSTETSQDATPAVEAAEEKNGETQPKEDSNSATPSEDSSEKSAEATQAEGEAVSPAKKRPAEEPAAESAEVAAATEDGEPAQKKAKEDEAPAAAAAAAPAAAAPLPVA